MEQMYFWETVYNSAARRMLFCSKMLPTHSVSEISEIIKF